MMALGKAYNGILRPFNFGSKADFREKFEIDRGPVGPCRFPLL
jgi:hypothetical protein